MACRQCACIVPWHAAARCAGISASDAKHCSELQHVSAADGGCMSGTMIGRHARRRARRGRRAPESSSTRHPAARRRGAPRRRGRCRARACPFDLHRRRSMRAKRGRSAVCASCACARSRRVDVATARGNAFRSSQSSSVEQARLERDAFALDDGVVGDMPRAHAARPVGKSGRGDRR